MPNSVINSFLSTKKKSKKELLKELDLPSKKPMIGILLEGDVSERDEMMLKTVVEALSHIDVNIVVISEKDHQWGTIKNMRVIDYDRKKRKKLLEAADIALGLNFNDVEEMLLNGVIPVSHVRAELEDYNPNQESGNAFLYKGENPWSAFAALVRAIETYKFPYDWKNIVRDGIGSVKS
ncbi:hypothetical protein KJ632_04065 [Patescibacteria group bacterium]|nr:hypothetical protein [Patescibacteria group bacterium]